MKSLDLKSEHVPVADSGTGAIAKELFELSGRHNLIWCTCVDPSVEMQEVAWHKKAVYPAVVKTAEEFFANPQISDRLDRVLTNVTAHRCCCNYYLLLLLLLLLFYFIFFWSQSSLGDPRVHRALARLSLTPIVSHPQNKKICDFHVHHIAIVHFRVRYDR